MLRTLRYQFGIVFLPLILAVSGCARTVVDHGPLSKAIKLPAGFSIEYYCDKLPGARSMALADDGTLFVGTRNENGAVYALPDRNHDGKVDEVLTIAQGMNSPNGIAIKDGSLYVAEINRVLRFDDILSNLKKPPKPVVVNDSFPKEGHHGWKYIRFGPDGWLYVPVGAPCNVCKSPDPRFASIIRMKPDGSQLEIFAHGIRNTVGFDWQPATNDLWFTDNGRDWLGNNLPPDELDCAPKKGMHFGFPYCHGNGLPDPEFGKGIDCKRFTPCEMPLGPHVAALGMRFYTGQMFPKEYEGDIFIAEHGSWNRVPPLGYRITRVHFANGKPVNYEVFAQGWLKGNKPWGRPVDIAVMPDGAILVSDDYSGAIYRISYNKN